MTETSPKSKYGVQTKYQKQVQRLENCWSQFLSHRAELYQTDH